MTTNRFLISYMIIIILSILILGIFLSSDGRYYLKTNFINFVVFIAGYLIPIFIFCIVLGCLIFFIKKLIRKQNNKYDLKYYILKTTIIVIILFILGQLHANKNLRSNKTKSNNSNSSKSYLSPNYLVNKDYYHSGIDKFAILFPNVPTIHTGKNVNMIARSYQSTEFIGNSFILYSVTFVIKNDANPFVTNSYESKSFLKATLNEFMNSIGSEPNLLYYNSIIFLDQFYGIEYKFEFYYKGMKAKNKGIFFLDKNRIIRISLSYSSNLEEIISDKYSKFIESFIFITS